MSAAKENTCRKFQANIFNKSKCQNCFKPRELHLLTDQDLNQAKPIYGGWLCLAPEGTDFDNPMQRSRKWQRRFFVLYEHGCLRFALDESVSLPFFISFDHAIAHQWSVSLIAQLRDYIHGLQSHKFHFPRPHFNGNKRREPGPAKVAVTGSGIPEAEKTPDCSSITWPSREAEVSQTWSEIHCSPLHSTGEGSMVSRCSDQSSVNGDEVDRSGLFFHSAVSQPSHDPLSPAGSSSSRHSTEMGGVPRCLSPAPSDPFPSGSSLLSNGSHISGSMSSLDSDASGSTSLSRRGDAENRKPEKRSRLRSPERQESVFSPERSGRSDVIEKLEALELEHAERRAGVRPGRSETRRFQREVMNAVPNPDFHPCTLPPLRRAKSLDRRTTESVMTPDLLNFKKGWMVKLDEQGQWKKYWFVLTDHSLRYYKDSIAEEASDLDGEMDLSTCYSVTEYQAQRNYGFQIHTQEAVHTLSAMTAGIRRNWIQAVMKNVRPSTAPDVASLTDEHASCGPFESLARPDVTQDSLSFKASVEREGGLKKSRARERRREGRSKTFDWAEFRPIAQALAQQRAHEADTFQAELTERNKRREERRRRYESVTGSSFDPATDITKMDFESGGVVQVDAPPPSEERLQRVEDEIEQRWQQVEKTPIREERRVPLPSTQHNRDVEELKAQLESCHQQLMDSNQHKLELEGQLKNALQHEQQIRAGYISPATCERGFAAMEESHQKVIDELQKKHQRELEKLQEEKERLLAEETAATISAIEAMKNAHRTELERELEKTRKANSNTENADIEEIHKQHEEELMSYQREIEVLSEQYSQKCLENAHLAQALEAERQALRQCQRENQELNAHNQELNNRLAAEITKMRSMASEDGGDAGGGMQGKELYELEVMRRVKESEVQYLKQEINSLKDELQTAHRDKKYATDKYKDIYTELSIVRAKAERDLSRLREQLQQAHDALGQTPIGIYLLVLITNPLHVSRKQHISSSASPVNIS
uniref:Myosin phosphatase Rho-interacting protein-like n=1 Tax=Sinocyclocheilus grahami TaxID=75366 RepID=A0A672Q1K7_SINGR